MSKSASSPIVHQRKYAVLRGVLYPRAGTATHERYGLLKARNACGSKLGPSGSVAT